MCQSSHPAPVKNRKGKVDAGLLPHDYYKLRLPRWRYVARHRLLPLVQWETLYLAWMQENIRVPVLDSYFALTANLGTHTFFTVMLPIMFWFGFTGLGRGFVHVLASGVFFSGYLKDLFCLPRPLSPPLHRITMSDSAALEYGFPSTHSTNAVSIALYSLLTLHSVPDISLTLKVGLYALATIYTFSIVFGRLYCGMHGFLDVIVGSVLGALLAMIEWSFRDPIDAYIYSGGALPILVILGIILILVRIHPEPADACPCFDDGVAFAAVVGGVEFGCWHYSKTMWSWNEPVLGTVPFSYKELGLLKTTLRLIFGIVLIFLWREVAKPTLHYILPPLYLLLESAELLFHPRDLTPAAGYQSDPKQAHETLLSHKQIPSLVRSMKGSLYNSVGPQSEADAYETIAYRERRIPQPGYAVSGNIIGKYEEEVGTGNVDTIPALRTGLREREVIYKPRVGYNIEVVTKLVVYAGIAWWAVEGLPIIFQLIGLGITD